jgi:hypothetical protein
MDPFAISDHALKASAESGDGRRSLCPVLPSLCQPQVDNKRLTDTQHDYSDAFSFPRVVSRRKLLNSVVVLLALDPIAITSVIVVRRLWNHAATFYDDRFSVWGSNVCRLP